MKDNLSRYLRAYAEKEAHSQDLKKIRSYYDRVVVVPVCDERDTLPLLLRSLQQASAYAEFSILCILVLNHHHDATPSRQQENFKLLQDVRERTKEHKMLADLGGMSFYGQWQNLDLMLIDRCSLPWSEGQKGGVGFARKLGCDIALGMHRQIVTPILYVTDADAEVPRSYFTAIEEYPQASAFLYAFTHEPTPDLNRFEEEALNVYDRYLRYYRNGLRFAQSPYAYDSLGSLIAVSFVIYAQVRGFPKKQAGEDFYFLNKVRKMATIESLLATIKLKGRLSDRVPFGTGPSVKVIAQQLLTGKAYRTFHPQVFFRLKKLLYSTGHFFAQHARAEMFMSESLQELCLIFPQFSYKLQLQNYSLRHFHQDFDGLKTWQYLQQVKNDNGSSLSLTQAELYLQNLQHEIHQ